MQISVFLGTLYRFYIFIFSYKFLRSITISSDARLFSMLRYHQWGNRGQFLNKSYVNNRNEPKLIFIGKIYGKKIHSVALYVKSGPNKTKNIRTVSIICMFYAFLINAYTWINFLNIKIIEVFIEEKKFKPG